MKGLKINLHKIIKIWDHSIFSILFKNNLLRLISHMKIENLISRISLIILLYLEFYIIIFINIIIFIIIKKKKKKKKNKKGDILWIIENMKGQNIESTRPILN